MIQRLYRTAAIPLVSLLLICGCATVPVEQLRTYGAALPDVGDRYNDEDTAALVDSYYRLVEAESVAINDQYYKKYKNAWLTWNLADLSVAILGLAGESVALGLEGSDLAASQQWAKWTGFGLAVYAAAKQLIYNANLGPDLPLGRYIRQRDALTRVKLIFTEQIDPGLLSDDFAQAEAAYLMLADLNDELASGRYLEYGQAHE